MNLMTMSVRRAW